MSCCTTNKKLWREKFTPILSKIFFLNLILSTIFLVLTSGLLFFLFKPWPTVSNNILCFGAKFLIKSQFWLPKNIQLKTLSVEERKGLFMANHKSILDTFILLALIPGLKVLAKQDLFKVPFLGKLMSISGQIPLNIKDIDSINNAIHLIESYQKNDIPVLIYPEMTRSPKGFSGLQKFVSFPFAMAFRNNIPICPAILKGTDKSWPKGALSVLQKGNIQVRFLEKILPKTYPSHEILKKTVWNVMNEEILKP